MNWSLKEVENLPRISYGYVLPYLNEIKEHPEIYERKALFFDLVCTGINGRSAINDDVIVFIRDQLKKNGTWDAMEQGKLDKFIIPEAEKEGYSFSRYRRYPGNQREQKEMDEYIFKRIQECLRTKDERYADIIKDNDNFSYIAFSTNEYRR